MPTTLPSPTIIPTTSVIPTEIPTPTLSTLPTDVPTPFITQILSPVPTQPVLAPGSNEMILTIGIALFATLTGFMLFFLAKV